MVRRTTRFERLARGSRRREERDAITAPDVHAIENKNMEMRVQVQARTKPMNEGDGASIRIGVPCTLRPRPIVERETFGEDAAQRGEHIGPRRRETREPSKLRSRLAPKCTPRAPPPGVEDVADVPRRSPYRRWAELLRRTFGFDVLACARCGGRMRLLATVTEPKSGYRATSELSVSRPKRPRERRRAALRSGRATSSEERPSATRPPSNAGASRRPREGSVRSPKTASPRGLRELRRGPSDLRRAGTPPLCILQPVAATPKSRRILA